MNAGKATAWMQQNKICISLLMLALTATCGLVTYNLTSEAGELGRRSLLEPPEVRLLQNHANTGEAIHHVHQAATSWNRMTASPKVHPADQEDWKRHTANAAVQQGWYPHTDGNQRLNLIVPERDRNLLEGLEEDAYDWLEKVSVRGAPAIGPELGKDPLHVTLTPTQVDDAPSNMYLAALAPIILGCLFMGAGVAVWGPQTADCKQGRQNPST